MTLRFDPQKYPRKYPARTSGSTLRLGCAHCAGMGMDPGWIEQCNNGPTVPCPMCNPITERDIAWDRAETQRAYQRRLGQGRPA